jgi:hypothetical protein
MDCVFSGYVNTHSGTEADALFPGMDRILPAVQNFMGELVQAFTADPKLNPRKISPDPFYSATAGLSA